MTVVYKDISQLSQKSSVAGTEKIEVSDTQYITPDQIATHKRVFLEDEEDMPATPDGDTLYMIEEGDTPMTYQHLSDQSEMPVSPDPNTLYLIDDEGIVYERVTNKVTSLSSSSTNTQYPSAKCVYDLLGDVETLINAL